MALLLSSACHDHRRRHQADAQDRLAEPRSRHVRVVAVGLLYLAESVELGFSRPAVLASTGSLAAAATTRLFNGSPPCSRRARYFGLTRPGAALHRRARRAAGLVCVLPAVLLVASAVRRRCCRGIRCFPLTFPALPVGSRVPVSVVQVRRVGLRVGPVAGIFPTSSSARGGVDRAFWLTPGARPGHGRAAAHSRVARSVVCRARGPRRPGRRALADAGGRPVGRDPRRLVFLAATPSSRSPPSGPSRSPSPRRVLPPFGNRRSLISAALVAPPVGRVSPRSASSIVGVVSPGRARGLGRGRDAACLVTRSRSPALVAHAAALSVALAQRSESSTLTVAVRFTRLSRTRAAHSACPPETVPQVAAVETASGLKVLLPQGTDQCWRSCSASRSSGARRSDSGGRRSGPVSA